MPHVCIYCHRVRCGDLPHTHEEVGLGGGLPKVLLDVLGLVGHHADEGVELDDGDTQVDQVHGVSQQDPQGRDEICERERCCEKHTAGLQSG